MVAAKRKKEPSEEQIAFGARLRAAIGLKPDEVYANQRVQEFIKLTGMTRQGLVLCFRGKRTLGARPNSLMAAHLAVDSDWLATGRGEMRSLRTWPFATVAVSEWLALDQSLRDSFEQNIRVMVDITAMPPDIQRSIQPAEVELAANLTRDNARAPKRARAKRR